MLSLFGAGIGRGIAIGKAYVLKNSDIETQKRDLKKAQVGDEIERFRKAVQDTEHQYRRMQKDLPKDAPQESSAFITAHMMMLRDPLLVDESIKIIEQQRVNAEYALQKQAQSLIKVFEQMQDAYLREKKNDVTHITNRLLRNLLGIVSHNLFEMASEDLSGRIIIGKDISPAETLFIKKHKIAAFATDLGSQISHTAVVARSLKLPAVVGLHGASRYIQDNDLLVVDGARGIIVINPDKLVLQQYRAMIRSIRQRERGLIKLIKKPSKTKDGKRIKLLANIETIEELSLVKKVNAAGIGLFRTEYLFMNREVAPSENEQFKAYKKIVTTINRPVVIRTLDVGGDKRLLFDYMQKESSESPLGLRAVRLCLHNMELFKPQLRAMLRASAFGKVSILIPMMTNIDELIQVKTIIGQTKSELKSAGHKFDPRIKIGGMIEVPATAIMADQFASKLDFLAIGTNDLIQYTLAIDRVDDAVNYLYDPIHPAVLRLIERVIKAADSANIPVSLCGEMAGNVRFTRLLLGLGLRQFSMDANYLLDVKEQILAADTGRIRRQLKKILNAENSTEARDNLRHLNKA